TMDESSQALTSLLFADYQLENKMNIGFVGSPNIGSVALNSIKDSEEFRAFANIFGDGDRIFFISSIFGGTGAAGFPIMVKNIRQAENLAVSNKHLLKHAPIGGLTVLPYFSLNNSQGRRIDKADFVVKTQSALQYYNETLTSRDDRNVNVIFYLGDQVPSMPYDYDPGDIKDQHDPAHLVEMVGALAPLKFAGMSNESIYDNMGGFRPTKAFEYGLERDVIDLDFASFGLETRSLIYKPMVKFRLLYMYLTGGFERVIGQGYTQDQPKIKSEFTGSQFYRTLTQSFFGGYTEWLDELEKNMRHVSLFNTTATDMGAAVKNVSTRKTLFGHKSINADVLNAEMNRISRDAKQYEHNTVEYKLLDLVDRAAGKVIDDRLDNIN
ncbi:MAG: hypothetical protein IK092_04490, partial [Muribaculaceae bacterium]|nr:hypothetical protein [Muribaculaceae bacterium]